MNSRFAIKIPGLSMKNPLMPASGTFGFGDVALAEKFDLNKLGALVIKTTTLNEKIGNPDPKIAVLANGVLNSVGLKNPGVDVVISEKIPALREKYPDLPIMGSIGGTTIDDYVEVADKLASTGQLDALELNISCPNVRQGGMAFGTNSEIAKQITKAVKQVTGQIPVYVKLSPNVTDIVEIAKAVENGGADGISMINTILGMHIDVKTRKPVIGNKMGGFSGSSIKPIAVRMIYQVAHAVNIPIIGMGGVETVDDVIEMYLAGASAVAVGSAHFNDAEIIPHLAENLIARMDELNIDSLESLRKQVKNEFNDVN